MENYDWIKDPFNAELKDNVLNISEEEFIEKIKRGEVINVTWDDENETQQSYCIDRKKVIKGFTGYGVSDD